jgi:polyisoprenoid-binding protein YceI
MLRIFRGLFLIACSTLVLTAAAQPAGERFVIDPNHSTIGFSVKHMMITNVHGRFNSFAGTLMIDTEDISRSTAEVVIEAASIDTDTDRRDAHLRSADFFDVEKFPQIRFIGSRVEQTPDGLVLVGSLTMHGVSRVVRIPFEMTGPLGPAGGRRRVGIEGELKIDRREFGLVYNRAIEGGNLIGDDVKIELSIEANTPAPANQGE